MEMYELNDNCSASNIIYDRLKAIGHAIDGVQRLRNAGDRTRMVAILRRGGAALCQKIGIPYVDTAGVHDVTNGQQPFGDFYYCDMLAGLVPISGRVIDFGCSSGRVIRNLKAIFPDTIAYGCDPRAPSIELAKREVESVNWFVSPEVPPMEFGKFDIVFAISVWSHFSEERALDWFSEFARNVPAGGKLIFSTHGYRSIIHFRDVKKSMPVAAANDRLAALNEGQFHFMPYGKGTDLNEHWGVAFMPRDWPEKKLTEWSVTAFHPGLAMANQDVYVLQRRE